VDDDLGFEVTGEPLAASARTTDLDAQEHWRGVLTGLGILVGTFIFTFFIGTLKDVWASGNWGELLSFKVAFSVALFVLSFFIPKAIRRIRGEGAAEAPHAHTE
jgi:hypothetical protein